MNATAALIPFLSAHTVTVTPAAGDGAYGPAYGDPYDLSGFLDRARKTVVDSNGRDVLTEATLWLPADTAEIPDGSTVAAGDWTGTVVGWQVHDAPGLPVPAHAEVSIR